MEYPDLYNLWLRHDIHGLGRLYAKSLREEDYEVFWELMERKYLSKYPVFLRLEYEFDASGLVWIPYPGSISQSPIVDLGANGIFLPTEVRAQLQAWVEYNDQHLTKEYNDTFRLEASRMAGSLALQIVKHIPSERYFEFRPLRQICNIEGHGIELDYDEEIRRILRF